MREVRAASRVVNQSYPHFVLNLAAYKDVVLAHNAKDGSFAQQFELFDPHHTGKMNALNLLGGLLIVCKGIAREKASFAFMLFDASGRGATSLTRDELVIMMASDRTFCL